MTPQQERERRLIGHYLLLRNGHPRDSGLAPEHFTNGAHRAWWAKACELDRFDTTDLGIPTERWQEYTDAGLDIRPAELAAIGDAIRRHWAIAKVRTACKVAGERLADETALDGVCVDLLADVESARSGCSEGSTPLATVVRDVATDWATAIKEQRPVTLPMPLPALQDLLGGWRLGKVVVLGAKSSEHKTSFGRAACETVARAGFPCLYFLMEDDRSDLGIRTLASRIDWLDTKILGTATLPYHLQDKERLATMGKTVDVIAKSDTAKRFHIVDRKAPRISTIGPEIGKAVAQHGVRFVVLDFAQLIMPDKGPKGGDWWAHLSAEVHRLTAQHKVATLMLGQFETSAVRDMASTGRPPRITDMYGGDTFRQNAFGCLCMWKTAPDRLSIQIDKWKGGSQGTIENIPVDPAHDRIG